MKEGDLVICKNSEDSSNKLVVDQKYIIEAMRPNRIFHDQFLVMLIGIPGTWFSTNRFEVAEALVTVSEEEFDRWYRSIMHEQDFSSIIQTVRKYRTQDVKFVVDRLQTMIDARESQLSTRDNGIDRALEI